MKVAIIKYNAGNVISVKNSFEKLNVETIITDNYEEIKSADKVIFPGVGEASSAMTYLRERKLDKILLELKQPVLGICLGMQLLCEYCEEGNTEGLGIIKTPVRRFEGELKIPHVGWNKVDFMENPLFKNIKNGEYFYFVHSFYAQTCPETIATCSYAHDFSAAINSRNFFGVQFHPEKSGAAGLQLLKNFITIS